MVRVRNRCSNYSFIKRGPARGGGGGGGVGRGGGEMINAVILKRGIKKIKGTWCMTEKVQKILVVG